MTLAVLPPNQKEAELVSAKEFVRMLSTKVAVCLIIWNFLTAGAIIVGHPTPVQMEDIA